MGYAGRRMACLLTGTAIAMAPLGAMAQAVDDEAGATILQRIILGFGEPRVATDTPQAVSVITQDDIDNEQAASLREIFDNVPNTQIIGGGRVLGQTVNIRGIGQGESAADEGRIIVNVDGVPQFYEQYRMGGIFNDPELFRRVEVLRGPAASTLYGSGALGGVINFETKDASDFLLEGETAALRLRGQYDSNPNGFLGSTILAARLGPQAELLLAGNFRRAQDYEDGDGVEVDGSGFETPSGLAKATFFFDDLREQELNLSYTHFYSDEDDSSYNQLQGGTGFGTIDRTVQNQQAQIAYENDDSDNPWLDLRLSLSWNLISNEQRNSSLSPAFGRGLEQPADYEYETFNALAQNTFELTGNDWENFLTVGTQVTHQSRRTGVESPFGFHPEGEDFQVGVFAQNEFVWDDRLTIIPGLRVDYQRLEAADDVVGSSLLPPGTQSDVALSPKIAAMYDINDMFSVFGSYARTQRFPTLDEIYSSDFPSSRSPTALPNYSLDLEKETSNNFELGFVVSAFDIFTPGDAFDIKTTGFYNSITDLIDRQRNQYPQYVNVEEALIYGIEIEAAYESDNIFASLGFGYTYGDNETTGEPLETVAPPQITAGLGYRWLEHGLTFGWSGRFVFDETRADVPVVGTPLGMGQSVTQAQVDEVNLQKDGFMTHDLYANWTPDESSDFFGWEGRFRVENVFDEQYQDFLAEDPGMGRTFRVSLTRRFGV